MADANAASRLRAGMTYREVGRALGSVDSSIKQNIREALRQEAEAQKDYERTISEMRSMGLPSAPRMRSQVTVYGGDYALHFRDGRLVAWTTN